MRLTREPSMYYQDIYFGGPQGGNCSDATDDPAHLKYRFFPVSMTQGSSFAVYEYGHSETSYGITRRFYNFKKCELLINLQEFLDANQEYFSGESPA